MELAHIGDQIRFVLPCLFCDLGQRDYVEA